MRLAIILSFFISAALIVIGITLLGMDIEDGVFFAGAGVLVLTAFFGFLYTQTGPQAQ